MAMRLAIGATRAHDRRHARVSASSVRMTNVISRDALCLQAQSKTMTTLLHNDLSCVHFRVARFGRAARSYESTAHIQRCLAARLASRCDVSTPRAILELGCGTGLLTRRLRERFPDSLLV